MASILIVDDEEDIREMLSYNLSRENHQVRAVENGLACLKAVNESKPDLILLDVMMPEMDGIEVCENLKASTENQDILICFLTARSEDYSQIAGLESGGDDYVTKPIKPKVLISRINALLRRKEATNPVVQVTSKELKINREKYLVEKDGLEIQLPRKEFELLALLVSLPNHVFKREVILEKVWGTDIIVGDRTIDVHIRKLREKIGNQSISTVKGIGYKFND
ncbi:MAG: DNA-binding response regulator [Flavobacteriales bacterium]|nr:DNA-binding response regulator [Crocinitomicaceae bacterium]NBX80167.1 DNA-binding response regulator [Flavobacteriales bacterium]